MATPPLSQSAVLHCTAGEMSDAGELLLVLYEHIKAAAPVSYTSHASVCISESAAVSCRWRLIAPVRQQ